MPRAASRPGRAALILALAVVAILAWVDLTSGHSILRSMWNAVFPTETRGENMRDNVLDRVDPRR